MVLEENDIKLLIKPKRLCNTSLTTPKLDSKDLLKRNFKSDTYIEKVGLNKNWFKKIIIDDKKN